MKEIEILTVTDDELLDRCLRIRNCVFTVEKGVPKSIEVDEQDRIGSQCEHFLVRFNGQDVGTLRCLHLPDSVIQLQRFCFYSSFRSKGLGRAAMEQIEAHYRQAGMARIVMDAKFDIQDFYVKCGYAQTSGIFIEAGVKHVKMEKSLL